MSRSQFIEMLDRYSAEGRTIRLWLRDDDAIEPTALLSRLLDLSDRWNAPMTIAAIPADATPTLAELLVQKPLINVAVHGWDHINHAPPTEKKQELGLHRGEKLVLESLANGLVRVQEMFGGRAVPLLVPPWNRIAPALVNKLAALGYKALSVFGAERDGSPLTLVNTHVDIIDWKGNRGGRPIDTLYAEAATHLQCNEGPQVNLGVLTHHLVHDAAAWAFLDDLFTVTRAHPACRWVGVTELIEAA